MYGVVDSKLWCYFLFIPFVSRIHSFGKNTQFLWSVFMLFRILGVAIKNLGSGRFTCIYYRIFLKFQISKWWFYNWIRDFVNREWKEERLAESGIWFIGILQIFYRSECYMMWIDFYVQNVIFETFWYAGVLWILSTQVSPRYQE